MDRARIFENIHSGKQMRFAIIACIALGLFYLCVVLTVVFGVWGIIGGFVGWRWYALIGCVAVGFVSKITEIRLSIIMGHRHL